MTLILTCLIIAHKLGFVEARDRLNVVLSRVRAIHAIKIIVGDIRAIYQVDKVCVNTASLAQKAAP